MTSSLAVGSLKSPPAPAVGCTTCWAAKYCAAFSSLASPQPPPACPLVPKPNPKHARRPPAAKQ